MPYITQEKRKELDNHLDSLLMHIKRNKLTAGDLNYLFTVLVIENLGLNPNYQAFNDAIGALEGCKLELYRRKVASYEDLKVVLNGDVYFHAPLENGEVE